MSRQGLQTGEFGYWLKNYLSDSPANSYDVYYDHGDRNKDPEHVAAIKGFCGDDVSNVNRIADIDVMVVDQKKNVKLLIEIEERAVSPKKLLGNVLAILMCNNIAVKINSEQTLFKFSEHTAAIVAGLVPDKGGRLEKVRSIIRPRIKELGGYPDGINSKNVEIIFENNLSSTIAELKKQVQRTLGFV